MKLSNEQYRLEEEQERQKRLEVEKSFSMQSFLDTIDIWDRHIPVQLEKYSGAKIWKLEKQVERGDYSNLPSNEEIAHLIMWYANDQKSKTKGSALNEKYRDQVPFLELLGKVLLKQESSLGSFSLDEAERLIDLTEHDLGTDAAYWGEKKRGKGMALELAKYSLEKVKNEELVNFIQE